MTPEEYALYQKAVVFIKNNMENPDFLSVLKENKIRVIPSSLSYVIKKLEEVGYEVTKPEIKSNTLSTDEIKQEIKNVSVRLFSLINETSITETNSQLIIKFPDSAFYKKKQLLEDAEMLNTLSAIILKFSQLPLSIQ